MTTSFIVLSEVPIGTADAATALTYLGLAPAEVDEGEAPVPAEDILVRVVVPRDTERSLVAEIVDSLGVADLAAAWSALTERLGGERTDARATVDAEGVLAAVTDAFRREGCTVEGMLSEDDPLPVLRELLETVESPAVVVYSDPQLLEETFALDWAHKVEDSLQATVLHLYPGSPTIGTS
ncbi:hypothetical protein [Brachybacterium huguangmaarense]